MPRQTIIPRRGGHIKLVATDLWDELTHDGLDNLNWAAAGHTIDDHVRFPDDKNAIFGDSTNFTLGYVSASTAGVITLKAATDFAVYSLDGFYLPLVITPDSGAPYNERMLDQKGNDSIYIPPRIRVPTGGTLANDGIIIDAAAINVFSVHFNASTTAQFRLDGGPTNSTLNISFDELTGDVYISTDDGGPVPAANLRFTTPDYLVFGHGLAEDLTVEAISAPSDISALMYLNRNAETAAVADDVLATMNFSSDVSAAGAQQKKVGAIIQGVADDTWSTTALDYPTRLEFYTQSDGGGGDGTTTPHMVIDSTGTTKLGDGGTTDYASFSITGDVDFVGGAGLAYGSMYTNTDIAKTLTNQNQFYEIDAAQAWTTGKVHNCTFADPEITVTNAGTYLITYTVSANVDANSQEIEFGIMIDSTNTDGPAHGAAGVQSEGRSHRVYATLNDEGHQSGTAIIQLAAAKTISLAARNTTSGADTVHVEHANVTVVQIAGGSA